MVIDIIYGIILLAALVYGFSKGLIHSIVSLVAIVIAIMAAVHLSEVAAVYIDRFNVQSKYLPAISFIVVFILIYLIFRLLEKALEGFFKLLQLNILNKLAGAIIWGLIWTLFFSTVLFYSDNMQLLPLDEKADSLVFEKIEPLAPDTIAFVGRIIPPVKNIFNSLQEWFRDMEVKGEPDENALPQ